MERIPEELYKKDLHDPDNHDGVITHLEANILECKIKWALESITMNKTGGGDAISNPKRWCCESVALNIPANLESSAVTTALEKVSFHSSSKERQCQSIFNYCTLAFISHASKVILKILQTRLQQYVNHELPDDQAGFRKDRGARHQIANTRWIMEKQESSRKTSISAFLTTVKPLTVWITTNSEKFFKRWEYQTTLPASWEICMQVKKQQN